MYEAHSLSGFQEGDERPVRCQTCGGHIGTAHVNFSAIQCALCGRSENGEPLTSEAVLAYRASKASPESISMCVVSSTASPEAQQFSFSALSGRMIRALSRNKKKRPESPHSTAVAKERRRGRLFDGVDIGSISNLDEKLRRGQD